ncbi:MAG: AEC family transporter [Verrucomicrobiota bacterium]
MISYAHILAAIIPVFLIMATGFIIRRTGFISDKGDTALMKLSINLFLPSLILDKVVGNPLLSSSTIVLWAVGLGFGFVLVAMAICFAFAPLLGLEDGKGRRTFSITCGITNYGFMALPVMAVVFPGDEVLGVLFLHSLGIELAIWTLGITILSGASRPQWKLLINGPVIAIVLGLSLNASGLHTFLPQAITSVFTDFGSCAIPFGLLLVGAAIADVLDPKAFHNATRVFFGSCALRLGLLPLIMLTTIYTLNIAPELKQVVIVQAAMPAAVFPVVLARHYGGHPLTAVQVVIGTTIASALTMPLVISLALIYIPVNP